MNSDTDAPESVWRLWKDSEPRPDPQPGDELTVEQAEATGFTVDKHCYPWTAYKGPRFSPDEFKPIVTPAWPAVDESVRVGAVQQRMLLDLFLALGEDGDFFEDMIEARAWADVWSGALAQVRKYSAARSETRKSHPEPDADDVCRCGHKATHHIYYVGACRPGHVCTAGCTEFRSFRELVRGLND